MATGLTDYFGATGLADYFRATRSTDFLEINPYFLPLIFKAFHALGVSYFNLFQYIFQEQLFEMENIHN